MQRRNAAAAFADFYLNLKMKKDVIIVGAGPAGLAAAINLAKAGYNVIVYEQNSDVGFKSNGDFQGLENWTKDTDILVSLKQMNIKTNFKYTPIKSLEVYDYKSTKYMFKSRKPICYVVRRGNSKDCLDSALKQQAIAAGAKIIFNKKLPKNKADIVSTGFNNPAGIGEGIVFDTNIPNMFAVIRDEALAPGGYAYFLVVDKKACLMTCFTSTFSKSNLYFKRTLKRFQDIKSFKIKNPRREGCFMSFNLSNTAVQDKRLYVGEAAGFQDYLFGFGMRYAITSGYLAAQSIIHGKDYDELWKKEFGGQLKAGLANRLRFELAGNTGFVSFAKNTEKQDIVQYFQGLYNLSLYKAALVPFAKILYSDRKVFK